MEKHINSEELIVAVLQGEDYSEAIEELNGKGFYVTILNSTGGFLRKKIVTLMIGVKSKDLDEAIRSTQTLRKKNRNGISLLGTIFHRGNPSCFTILSSVNRTARQNGRSGILRH